eukprot:CAMPEP_0194756006 /NCGR_PEP_ID=MMETSP0323_2-20130528/9780_1 /TAXON_ID=2866 ORGANISM="Crypthecodinium cohnii, Strain Seligo" /NCGR_SAMPLE_ID=MMETSP0323_2 /ASSEMBLY_ACC=CAM_ASM_000346 /LENGTH=118 /DNA_ID=CAMNT_0039675325 /DNA_START=17 /DNA_END=373 /DNA_ORIENTATION=+
MADAPAPVLMMDIKRHVYNARGGAPPHRGSYHTASDTATVDPTVSLRDQMEKLGQSQPGSMSDPKFARIPKGKEPPNKWEEREDGCGEEIDLDSKPDEVFGKNGEYELVALLPMRGMD